MKIRNKKSLLSCNKWRSTISDVLCGRRCRVPSLPCLHGYSGKFEIPWPSDTVMEYCSLNTEGDMLDLRTCLQESCGE